MSEIAPIDGCYNLSDRLPMQESPFYRIGLDEQKVPISFDEIHPILRDVVHYFEVNLNEPHNVLIMGDYTRLEYWKYLSISCGAAKYAESKRYTWLCERGCLALLNGISLDFLTDQQIANTQVWQRAKALASQTLPYLKVYRPSDDSLEVGRDFLITAFTFIADMSSENRDENGIPLFSIQSQGAWFTTNIVGDYFRKTAKLDFG